MAAPARNTRAAAAAKPAGQSRQQRRRPEAVPVRPAGPRASVYALSILSLGIIFAAFAGTVALRVVLAEQQRTIDDLGNRIAAAQDERSELRIIAGQLESPDRVRTAALRLGLVPPPEVVYLPPVLPGNPATVLPAPVGDPFAAGPAAGSPPEGQP